MANCCGAWGFGRQVASGDTIGRSEFVVTLLSTVCCGAEWTSCRLPKVRNRTNIKIALYMLEHKTKLYAVNFGMSWCKLIPRI